MKTFLVPLFEEFNVFVLFNYDYERYCSFIQNPKSSLRFFLQTVLAEYYCVCQKLDVFC